MGVGIWDPILLVDKMGGTHSIDLRDINVGLEIEEHNVCDGHCGR